MNPNKYSGTLTAYNVPNLGYGGSMRLLNSTSFALLTRSNIQIPVQYPSIVLEIINDPSLDSNTATTIRYTIGALPSGYTLASMLYRLSPTPASSHLDEFKTTIHPYGWSDSPGSILRTKGKATGTYTYIENGLTPNTLYYVTLLVPFANRWFQTAETTFTTTNIVW